MFVVTETAGGQHTLVALNAQSSWRAARTASLDIDGRARIAEQQRGALAVANGRVYVPFGGLTALKQLRRLRHLDIRRRPGPHDVVRGPDAAGGRDLGAAGVAVDAAGDVWVAVGNGASTGGTYDGSDSVLRLSPDLSQRLDYFAPSAWGSQNARDRDLAAPARSCSTATGSSSRARTPRSTCSTRPPGRHRRQVARLPAARDSAASPGTRRPGRLRPVQGRPAARRRRAHDVRQRGWKAPPNIAGSPVVGNGAVWSVDAHAGRLTCSTRHRATSRSCRRGHHEPGSRSPVLTRGLSVLLPTLAGVSALSVG